MTVRPPPRSLWLAGVIGLASCHPAAARAPAGETIEYSIGVLQGREVLPVHPLTASEARGRWHWRLTRERGRVVRATHLGPGGRVDHDMRVTHDRDGTRTVVQTDAHGVLVARSRYAPSGRAARLSRGGVAELDGCHHRSITFDAAGRPLERLCLDASELAVVDDSGCQLWRARYDDQNQRVAQSCLATDRHGRPTGPALDDEGVHEVRTTYSATGLQSERRFLDAQGAPAARRRDGCHGQRTEHDDGGTTHLTTCLGPQGQPQDERGTSVASVQHDVDANGCPVVTVFLDTSGRPAARGELARIAMEVNPQCDVLERVQKRRDGSLLAWPRRVARWVHRFDDQGQRVATACFGAGGEPTSCTGNSTPSGAIQLFEYDADGRHTMTRSLGPDRAPTDGGNGYPHATELHYNRDGRIDARRFFDAEGERAVAMGQVALQVHSYNALGHLVRTEAFDLHDRPVVDSTGCHGIWHQYDDSGHMARITCLSPGGAPAPTRNLMVGSVEWPRGTAAVEIVRGARPANVFLDPDGGELQRVDCQPPEAVCYR